MVLWINKIIFQPSFFSYAPLFSNTTWSTLFEAMFPYIQSLFLILSHSADSRPSTYIPMLGSYPIYLTSLLDLPKLELLMFRKHNEFKTFLKPGMCCCNFHAREHCPLNVNKRKGKCTGVQYFPTCEETLRALSDSQARHTFLAYVLDQFCTLSDDEGIFEGERAEGRMHQPSQAQLFSPPTPKMLLPRSGSVSLTCDFNCSLFEGADDSPIFPSQKRAAPSLCNLLF